MKLYEFQLFHKNNLFKYSLFSRIILEQYRQKSDAVGCTNWENRFCSCQIPDLMHKIF